MRDALRLVEVVVRNDTAQAVACRLLRFVGARLQLLQDCVDGTMLGDKVL